jgi:hypothetical protein
MRGLLIFFLSVFMIISVSAQTELAASLEVLEATVTVQRVNTSNPIEVQLEGIVGVGDTITTGETGRARITFFADGTSTELEPSTIYIIEEFSGDEESFTLRVSVVAGQTVQQLGRALDASSSYEVETPAMTMAARGTVFAIRVEDTGRSAMLVSQGTVATNNDAGSANVPSEFGIRAEEDAPLSDVVRASSFEELDAALDGCSVTLSTGDDVSLNVRTGPSTDAEQIGYVSAGDIVLAMGQSESGDWYRFPYEDGFGWVLSSNAVVDSACAGLRLFPDNHIEGQVAAEPSAETTEEAP